jgi:oligo-1,6-glucosidase
MTNVAFESIEDYNDLSAHSRYHELVDEQGIDPAEALAELHAKSRDNARTPMQWSAEPQAGFTSGEPWLKVNPNYPAINARQAMQDPHSIFAYYQALIRLRKRFPALVYGEFSPVETGAEQVYAYTRELEGERLTVILNLGASPVTFAWPEALHGPNARGSALLIGNYPGEDYAPFSLRPYEARVTLG